ncbi:MAG TPA: hypothetical protein VF543_03535 [Pyrinomonadaceae bacterium]
MSSSCRPATHQVNKANTTTALTADAPDPSVIGQSHAVTAKRMLPAPLKLPDGRSIFSNP